MVDSSVTVTARCLCNANVFRATVPRASLPLNAESCHCTSCRHLMGSLCFTDIEWPDKNVDLSALKRYATSPKITTYSCPTCSTQMFSISGQATGVPCLISGALDHGGEPDLVRYRSHIFVGDTIDGGSSAWLRRGQYGELLPRWRRRDDEKTEELGLSWPEDDDKPARTFGHRATPDLTPVWCHCKGVNFLLRSGTDLMDDSTFEKPKYVDPETGKYMASIDACDSCRLSTGADLVYWTFVPVDHLLFHDASSAGLRKTSDLRAAVLAEQKDSRFGTLVMYESSEGVRRYHCSNCSATIFYTNEGKNPEQIDIAVGALDHPDGARAEGLIKWIFGTVDYTEDTKGGWREGLCKLVKREFENWRVEKSYPLDFVSAQKRKAGE